MAQPKIANESYELVDISALQEHPANPRRGQISAIQESIAQNGFFGAVVAQKKTGYILAGNHRFRAAIASGATQVPVIWVDVSDRKAKQILLSDNRTNDLASYDDSALSEILQSMSQEAEGLAGTGYGDDDLADLLDKISDLSVFGPPPSSSPRENNNIQRMNRGSSEFTRFVFGEMSFLLPASLYLQVQDWLALQLAGTSEEEQDRAAALSQLLLAGLSCCASR